MESEAVQRPATETRSNSRLAATALALAIFVGGFIAFAAWNGTWYVTWKAIHVLAAIVWIGGGLMIQLLAWRILRTDEPERLARFTKDVEFVSMRTFIPASLTLVVLGFVLMSKGNWDYDFWVIFALVGWALSFISGAFYIGPESGRIGKLIEARGGIDAEIGRRIERILLHSRIELALIALIAMDMIIKPGLG